jgi:uncharacterized membrane protein YjfL (UPF0719 family)
MWEQLKLGGLLSSVVYSLLGVAVFWLSFLLIDKLTPYSLWKELVDHHNVALGILVGAIALGICIIVASAMH